MFKSEGLKFPEITVTTVTLAEVVKSVQDATIEHLRAGGPLAKLDPNTFTTWPQDAEFCKRLEDAISQAETAARLRLKALRPAAVAALERALGSSDTEAVVLAARTILSLNTQPSEDSSL
jgi:hypothetical protein